MKPLETLLWTIGVMLLAAYVGTQAWGALARDRDLAAFAAAKQGDEIPRMVRVGPGEAPVAATLGEVQQPTRDAPVAVLRIPGIDLQVPVSYGTGDSALRRGAGLISGTALPGTNGNVAIAAHRDTFFRGLSEVELGDLIELDSLNSTLTYRVTELFVVEPTDVHVLADTGERVLTLVTCFPFHFVGSAPQRFIVRAVPDDVST
jgi:sortase A